MGAHHPSLASIPGPLPASQLHTEIVGCRDDPIIFLCVKKPGAHLKGGSDSSNNRILPSPQRSKSAVRLQKPHHAVTSDAILVPPRPIASHRRHCLAPDPRRLIRESALAAELGTAEQARAYQRPRYTVPRASRTHRDPAPRRPDYSAVHATATSKFPRPRTPGRVRSPETRIYPWQPQIPRRIVRATAAERTFPSTHGRAFPPSPGGPRPLAPAKLRPCRCLPLTSS